MHVMDKRYVFIGCRPGTTDLFETLVKSSFAHNAADNTQIRRMQVSGLYSHKNIMRVMPEDVVYADLNDTDVEAIVKEHFVANKPVERLMMKPEKFDYLPLPDKALFYNRQYRIVLKNAGIIDPESIDDYIARFGYRALAKALGGAGRDVVINELKKSGLRGRGGGGYPTWMKWKFAMEQEAKEKYIICNADEGDPGAYMDRSVLEGDPHAVIEGMLIAGYTVGATNGYIYCRAEYPLAIARLEIAIKKAREYGFLGQNILGTGTCFDIEIRLGAGAFVCGEETALIASVEGQRGMPRPRPPYPAVKGVWGQPTIINNVETFANIPVIMYKGGDWYGAIGTKESKGTKVFAVTGKVNNCGLVEVPMGTKLRDLVYDIAGGISSQVHGLKAVQTGGPSGGLIPAKFIDVAISYEALKELGSIMGSGGMIVMDESNCVVDVAKFYLGFAVDESCGKCSPCRIGTTQLLNLLEQLTKGHGTLATLVKMREIAEAMQKASLCGLGQTAPNPVLSGMRYFPEEYSAHVYEKSCKTKNCKDLIKYSIVDGACIGCTVCAKKCPVSCIKGNRKETHVIDQSKCIKCGECMKACKFDAIIVS